MTPVIFTIAAIVVVTAAFVATVLSIHNMTFPVLVHNEFSLNGSSSTVDDDNSTLRTKRALAQNAWWKAQKLLSNDLGFNDLLRADVMRRDNDGLIVVHPFEWYIYYRPGDKFYYMTNTFSNSTKCSSNECSVVLLTPVLNFEEPVSTWKTGCLTTDRLELLNLFSRGKRLTVPLDSLLEQRSDDDDVVTIIEVLNELIERRVL